MRTTRLIQMFSILLMIGLILPQGGPNPVIADLGDDFYEDFEGIVFPSWSATGLWHLEDNTTSSYPINEIPSGSRYMWYGDNTTGNFNTSGSNSGVLDSDPFDLTGFNDSVFLEFWSYADTELGDRYDRKQVFISTDGMNWQSLGNITLNTNVSSWEYVAFDITAYKNASSVQVRFGFDSVDNLNNLGRGWLIDDVAIVDTPADYFDLRIDQDTIAKVGERHTMYFFADSYFGHDMNVTIEIEAIRPSNISDTLYYTTYSFAALSSWNVSVNYTFSESGVYTIRFTLIDDKNTVWEKFCYWNVSETNEYIDLWINQEYDAWVGDTKWMEFFAYSNFNHSMPNVTIKIEISGPDYALLYYSDSVYLTSYSTWNFSTSFTFNYEGTYEVYFYLIDDIGTKWETWCNWEVKEFYEHFELSIYQENFAVVNHSSWADFYIRSYFSHTMPNVSIKIEVYRPDDYFDIIYYNDSYYFENNSEWFFYTEYFFTLVGRYDVRLSLVDDIGTLWEAWCWWEVFETSTDFLWLEIQQDYIATVGENRWMNFRVYSNYTNDLTDVIINATITTPSGSTYSIALWTNVTLYSRMWWEAGIDYFFTEVGHYEVFLIVITEQHGTWEVSCPWDINEGVNDLDFWIEQDTEIQVNNFGDMRFVVVNNFPDPITLDIKIFIEKDGVTLFDNLFDYVYLDPGSKWEAFESFLFNETGTYLVRMEIYDSYDYSRQWGPAYCQWDVYEQDDYLDVSINNPDRVLVNTSFTANITITNFHNFSVDVYLEFRIFGASNGSELFYYNDSYTALHPNDKWELSLIYTPSVVGSYKVELNVWTSVDSLSFTRPFDVVSETDINNTTTEPSQTSDEPTLELTPGFEYFLLPLVMVTLVYFKKRRF